MQSVVAPGMAIALASSGIAQTPGAAADDLPFRLGAFSKQIVEFNKPAAVAISENGEIFVTDTLNRRVAVVDREGNLLRTFGEDVLRSPGGIAIDIDEPQHLWVADEGCLVQFDLAGNVQLYAELGLGRRPLAGIAGSRAGVLAADEIGNRIVCAGPGSWFGEFGSNDGQFNHPTDVAVDEDGFIYVADSDNNRIQKFDVNGNFITKWGQWGPFPGMFDRPTGVEVRDDRVFVADQQNHRIQVFTTDGKLIYRWGVHALLPREGEGKLHYPADIAIDPNGNFAVICEGFENRIQIFECAADEITEAQLNTPPPPFAQQTHFGDYLDIDGKLLAIGEPESHTIYIFRIDRKVPVIITQFGMQGTQPGRFSRIGPIALDAEKKVLWVADQGSRVLQMFSLEDLDAEGEFRMQPFASRFVRAVDPGTLLDDGAGPIDPVAIDVDRVGRVLVADQNRDAVVLFEPESREASILTHWPEIADLRLSADGGILWCANEAGTTVVGIRADSSAFASHASVKDHLTGQLRAFLPLRSGWIAVDIAAGELVRMTDDQVERIGTFGSDNGQLWHPGQVRVADDGRIFVVDRGNHRAQIFSPGGEWLVTFGVGRARTNTDRPENDE